VHGRRALVIGGNDEAGTMYAAYDFLERLGFVFLLTKDILPQKNADVLLPALDERIEPAFTGAVYTLTIAIPTRPSGRWRTGSEPSIRWPRCE
jgi:hypothetical protein